MNAQLPPDFAAQLQGAIGGADAPPPPAYRQYLKFGYVGVAVLAIGLFGWAALAQIKGAVMATGYVGVEGKPAIIQHLDGGIAGEIFVRDGAKVEAGDPLIRLVPTEVDANREIVQVQLNETRARVERLKAERDGLPAIEFPDDLIQAALTELRVERAIDGQKKLFEARRAAMRGQTSQLLQRIRQAEDQIVGLAALIRSNREQIAKLREETEAKRTLVEKGFLAKPAILVLEREQLRLRGDVESRQADIDRLQAQITETRGQIAQLRRDMQAEVLTELRGAEAEASGFREQLTAADAQSQRVLISSPVSGTVHNLTMTTTGGVVQPAAEIMQIIPTGSDLIILAQVQPQDIDQVFPGQKTTVRLSAFNARTTPELNAEVTRVAPDRIIDPMTGFPYYEVEVRISDEELGRLPSNLTLLPGMPAEAFMQTESRSVLNYLMKPALDAMKRAGREE